MVSSRFMRGAVLDRRTLGPVSGARICLKYKGLHLKSESGERGQFEIMIPQDCAEAILHISKSGFYSRNIAKYAPNDKVQPILITPIAL